LGDKYTDIVDALKKGIVPVSNEGTTSVLRNCKQRRQQHASGGSISHGGWIAPDSLAVAYKREVDKSQTSPFGLERLLIYRHFRARSVYLDAKARSRYPFIVLTKRT